MTRQDPERAGGRFLSREPFEALSPSSSAEKRILETEGRATALNVSIVLQSMQDFDDEENAWLHKLWGLGSCFDMRSDDISPRISSPDSGGGGCSES